MIINGLDWNLFGIQVTTQNMLKLPHSAKFPPMFSANHLCLVKRDLELQQQQPAAVRRRGKTNVHPHLHLKIMVHVNFLLNL